MADGSVPFTTDRRRELFLEAAARPEGTTVADVYRSAMELGDTVTEEAYYNMARRLEHRGLLLQMPSDGGTRYRIGSTSDRRWLEEDELSTLVNPEYPLLALAIWKEARRQIHEIPETLWTELRERLSAKPGRELFLEAILSYCEDFHAQIDDLARLERDPTPELSDRRQEAENSRRLLVHLTKHGLGLPREAVDIPLNLPSAIAEFDPNKPYADRTILEVELERRVAAEPFIVDVPASSPDHRLLIGAVDGSSRSGLLSFLGEEGDLALGHAPMVSLNTSIGLVDRFLREGSQTRPLFIRLPEKPEDAQRPDNRYTVMAKLLYPDMSDAQYMHSIWNAMDVVEARTVLGLLKRWSARPKVEVPPSDVVLRDGPVSPQDRDFFHYSDLGSYGQIVREMIELNWDIAKKCKEDGHTVGGIVKHAELSVFTPIINWFAARVAQKGGSQIAAWPMQSMNLVPDQVIITRLLTAGRRKGDPWTRTCIVMRPFHALEPKQARLYERAAPPSDFVFRAYRRALDGADADREQRLFWDTFRRENDPYVKMLENVFYATFFLGAVPRLDIGTSLPRIEGLVTASTGSTEDPWPVANRHRDRLLTALQQHGFDVSAEHSMFRSDAAIDVLPRLSIRAHDTVKLWAADLLARVQEYVGSYLARYVNTKKFRGVKVRPFTRDELKILYDQLKRERELQAGTGEPRRMLDE